MILDLDKLKLFIDNINPVNPWEFVGNVIALLAKHNLDITINNYVATKRVPERCSIVIYEGMTPLIDTYFELSENLNLPKAIVLAALSVLEKRKLI